MFLQDLQSKDVVNVVDGTKLGKITDLEIDSATGKIIAVIVTNSSKWLSFFTGSNQTSLQWNQIVKIGGEVIIVNSSSQE
ncbi:MAG TPA: YlmC/YmxH family sporulation protein [Acholeplasmataceae bacterium]|nr:YlmC/YmxH family sporulation protein [Acholeplasmataceae bacterium]